MKIRLRRLSFVFGVLAVLVAILAPAFCRAQQGSRADVLRFGVVPYQSPKDIVKMYAPLAAALEKKLGKKIKLSSATDNRAFLAKARAGEYDLLLTTPVLFYKLRPSGYRVIARGEPSFYGGVIVRKDSEITTIEQLQGKRIAAIGEHSYGGYRFLLPQLVEKGVDPQREVEFQFLDKVSIIIYGVVNRTVDAGILQLDTLDIPSFADVRGQLRVISRSPEIPRFPFIVNKDLDGAAIAAIQEALSSLSADRPEDLAILNAMQISRIVAATNADYEQFYELVKDSEFFRQP
jgi:phosphonate transport system substrate-binding protein